MLKHDYNLNKMKIKYKDDESIIFKNKIIHPVYSFTKSLKLFNKILLKILNKKKYREKIIIKNYNILTVALEDFLWQFCFQYTKYEKFIKKEGINLDVIKPKKKIILGCRWLWTSKRLF